MNGLLAGICAGGVVGAIGLAIGLTVVPPHDPAAVQGEDRAAAAELAGPDPEASTIFPAEPEAAADPDPAEPAPKEQAEDDIGSIFEQDASSAPAADVVSDAPAGSGGGGHAAELAVEDTPETERPSDPEQDAATGQGEAASLADEALVPAAQVPEASVPEDQVPEAEASPPPAAQVVAPHAPSLVAVQTTGLELTLDPALGEVRDEVDERPAALGLPEMDFAPPAFDAEVPPPEPLPQPEDPPEVADDGDAATIDAEPDTRPALVRNAAAEPPPAGVPLLALVLVDRPGAGLIDGVPLSVAIAADAEDAGARADAWHAAGAEIVAIPGLPAEAEGTGPVALFDATFGALPRAASVMAEGDQGFAAGPVAANDIAATLAETGHGLIVRGRDLGPVAQAAERAGVPTAGIYRRVDGSGRDGRAIGRFLDQAAFEARNRGAVVVIADNTPETAEGIERFLDSSRADTVALVPVSAILRRE